MGGTEHIMSGVGVRGSYFICASVRMRCSPFLNWALRLSSASNVSGDTGLVALGLAVVGISLFQLYLDRLVPILLRGVSRAHHANSFSVV